MSFIKVRDQNGNPPPPEGRLDVALTPNGFDTPQDRRFTDNSGNVSFTGCNTVWPDAHGKFKLDVNTANVNKNYGTASLTVNDIEAQPYDIVVQKVSSPPVNNVCPVDHNKDQFRQWFFDMVVKRNLPICSNDAMQQLSGIVNGSYNATFDDMKKCNMLWQNQMVYSPDKWRPRIFQPPQAPPNYDSPWYVDCGEYGKPWELTFRY